MRPVIRSLFAISVLLLSIFGGGEVLAGSGPDPEQLREAKPIPRKPRDAPFGLDSLAPQGAAITRDLLTGEIRRVPLRNGGREVDGTAFQPGLPQPEAVRHRSNGVFSTQNFSHYTDTENRYIYPYSTTC